MKEITNETDKSAEKPDVDANATESRDALLGDFLNNEPRQSGSDKQTGADNESGKDSSLFLSVMLDKVEGVGKSIGNAAKSVVDALTGESADEKGHEKTAGKGKPGPAAGLDAGEAKNGAGAVPAAELKASINSSGALEAAGELKGAAKPGQETAITKSVGSALESGIKNTALASFDAGEGKSAGPNVADAGQGKPRGIMHELAAESKGGDLLNTAAEGKSRGSGDQSPGEGKPAAGEQKGFWNAAISKALEANDAKGNRGSDKLSLTEAGELKASIVAKHITDSVVQNCLNNCTKDLGEKRAVGEKGAENAESAGSRIGKLISMEQLDGNGRYGKDVNIAFGDRYGDRTGKSSNIGDMNHKTMQDSAIVPIYDTDKVPFPPTKHEIVIPREESPRDASPNSGGEVNPPKPGITDLAAAAGVGGAGVGGFRDDRKGDFGPGGPIPQMNPADISIHSPHNSSLNSIPDVGPAGGPLIPATHPSILGSEVIVHPPTVPKPEPVQVGTQDQHKEPSVTMTGTGLEWLAKPSQNDRYPHIAYINSQQNDRFDHKQPETHNEQKPHRDEVKTEKPVEHKPEQKAEPKPEQKQLTPEQKAKLEAHENTQRIIDNAVKSLANSKFGPTESIIGSETLKARLNAGILNNERTSSNGVPIANAIALNGKTTHVPEHVSSAENAPGNMQRNNNFNLNDAKTIVQPQLVQKAIEAAAKNTNLNLEQTQLKATTPKPNSPAQGMVEAGKSRGENAKGMFASAIESNTRIANLANSKEAMSLKGMLEANNNRVSNTTRTWAPEQMKLRSNVVSERGSEVSVSARQNALKQIAAASSAELKSGTTAKDRPVGLTAIAKQEIEAAQLLVNRLSTVANNSAKVFDSKTGTPGAVGAQEKFNMPPDKMPGHINSAKSPFKPLETTNKSINTGFNALDTGMKKLDGQKGSEFRSRDLQEPAELSLPIENPADSTPRSPAHTAFLLSLILSMSGMSRKRNTLSMDGLEEIIYSIKLKDDSEEQNPFANRTMHRRTHMVETGDTLQSIAEKYFADARVAWLIADLNYNNVDEHGIDEKRVVELKVRQSIELPEPIEVSEFLFRLPRNFDIEQKLVTLVTDTMVNLEVLKQFLGPLLGSAPAAVAAEPKPADQRKDLLGDFTILGADCA